MNATPVLPLELLHYILDILLSETVHALVNTPLPPPHTHPHAVPPLYIHSLLLTSSSVHTYIITHRLYSRIHVYVRLHALRPYRNLSLWLDRGPTLILRFFYHTSKWILFTKVAFTPFPPPTRYRPRLQQTLRIVESFCKRQGIQFVNPQSVQAKEEWIDGNMTISERNRQGRGLDMVKLTCPTSIDEVE